MKKHLPALLCTLAVMLVCCMLVLRGEPTADGAPASLAMVEGGALFFEEGRPGITFKTRVLTSELAALGSDATVGMLILPTDLIGDSFSAESESVIDLTSASEGVSLNTDGEYTVFSVTLANVQPHNLSRAFSARSYIRVGETYYYAAYSDVKNARSVYGLAVAAWTAGERENADVRRCLDRALPLDEALGIIPLEGYTSPYAVSYANDTITVTATDGTLVEGDIDIVMINGTVYTGGWTVENNTLTAPYEAK